MFFKDNPSFNMHTLIDFTAVDYPNEEKRFLLIYNLLSVSKNFRIKIKTWVSADKPVSSVTEIFPCANWYERKHGIYLELVCWTSRFKEDINRLRFCWSPS